MGFWPLYLAYNAALCLAFVGGLPLWFSRYGSGLKARLWGPSIPSRGMGSGELRVWINAVSVGEVQAAYPVVAILRQRLKGAKLFLSSNTEAGLSFARSLLLGLVDEVFPYPFDLPLLVDRAVEAVSPDVYVTVEAEIWPNMFLKLKRAGIPVVVANGRFSERSFKRAPLLKGLFLPILEGVASFCMRTEEDAARLLALGLDPARVSVVGDTKVDAIALRKRSVDLAGLRARLSLGPDDPVVVAGSTHKGEEEVFLSAYLALKRGHGRLRALLVPRHVERAREVLDLVGRMGREAGLGLKSCLLSAPVEGWDAMVCDRIGLLLALYGLSRAVFVGGSLVDKGGQNPLEAAVWDVPICFGPHMEDFGEASSRLVSSYGARVVRSASEMEAFFREAMGERRARPSRFEELFRDHLGASSRVVESVLRVLEVRRCE